MKHVMLVVVSLIALLPLAVTSAEREQVLVDELRSLRMIDDATAMRATSQPRGVAVELSDLELPAFGEHFEQYLGEPLSLALLDQITSDVVGKLRDRGYPVVDAFAPEGQDITEGDVQIVVLVGRLGSVRVEGAEFFDPARLAEQIRLNQHQPITRAQLQSDLDWVNQNPFRSVNAILERGESFGQTDIVLEVEDRRPLQISFGANNAGFESVGEDRWQTGIQWGNAFGLEHQLSYQFAYAFETERLKFHTLDYMMPLASRHKLGFSGAYVTSSGDLDDQLLGVEAKNKKLEFWYAIPLASDQALLEGMTFSLEYLRSNNDLEFGGLNVLSSFTDIFQLRAGVSGSLAENLSYNWQFVYSPGDVTTDNRDDNFAGARFGAEAQYWYTSLAFGHLMRLPRDFTLATELTIQYTNENLLSSQQMVIGGESSVRGYDEFAVIGDRGVLLRSEVRTSPFAILGDENDRMQLLAFLDAGYTSLADRLPGEESTSLSSVGVGVRYAFRRNLQFRMDYGWQLEEPPAGEDSGRLHLRLDLMF